MLQPPWLPKALASTFILVAIAIFFAAQAKSAEVADRLECHKARPMRGAALRLIAAAMIVASAGLVAAIWLLDLSPR
jgi:putative membrane protein